MEVNTDNHNNDHFPVDREAPENEYIHRKDRSTLKDFIVLFLIIGMTVLTVPLSLYILISKYF